MKHWIAVASAEHARRGKVGFAVRAVQVGDEPGPKRCEPVGDGRCLERPGGRVGVGFDQRDAGQPGRMQAQGTSSGGAGGVDRGPRDAVGDDLDGRHHLARRDPLPARNGGKGNHRIDGIQRFDARGEDLDHSCRLGVQIHPARADGAEVEACGLGIGDESLCDGQGGGVFGVKPRAH